MFAWMDNLAACFGTVLAGLDEGESDCIAAAHQLHAEASLGRGTLVTVGLSRIVALYHRSSASHHIQLFANTFGQIRCVCC